MSFLFLSITKKRKKHIDCKSGTTAEGQIYWPIFQLAELVFFRASTENSGSEI